MPIYYPSSYKRKTIDGLLFASHSFTSSKKEAQEVASKLRKNGRMARVIKTGKVWSVYSG